LFADITDTAADASNSGNATTISGAPNAAVYPNGMIVVNMAQSRNTVRSWNGTAWRNAAANHADGSGAFGRFAQRKVIATAMQAVAAGTDLRDPSNRFSLIAAPNYPELVDEMVTLNSDRGETAFIIVDAPMRKNPTDVISWTQNTGSASENGEDGLVTNNTYSAVYYPAGQTSEPLNGNTVTVPPSHMALYTFAYNDNISFQWFAPAGLTRGVVQNASAVGHITTEGEFKAVSLTQGQRDAMYTAKLNPITTFPGQGTVIFGQKTLHTTTSALDRVNVARLVAYLRDRFDELARPFLFEVNDAQTRERAKIAFERFLADILSRRGLNDFAVVCDESNNTPARIDRNEFYVDVAIEPSKAAEFIYIPIRLVNTGTIGTTN
jgi:phage tail sheath protein FI